MNKFRDDIGQYYFNHLAKYEEEPVATIWKNIEFSLDQNVRKNQAKAFFKIAMSIISFCFILPFSTGDGLVNEKRVDANNISGSRTNNIPVEMKSHYSIRYQQPERQQVLISAVMTSPRSCIDIPVLAQTFSSQNIKLNPIGLSINSNYPSYEKLQVESPSAQTHWVLSPFTSLDISHYRLVNRHPTIGSSTAVENRSVFLRREKQDPTFSAGFLLTRLVKENIGIQTGIIYSRQEIKIDAHTALAVKTDQMEVAYKLNTSTGYVYLSPTTNNVPVVGDSITLAESQHKLEYLTIPLTVELNKDFGRWSLKPAVGFTANFITRALLETEVENAGDEKVYFTHLKGLKKFYAGATTSVRVGYAINKRLSLDIITSARYAFTSITRKTEVANYPVSFGIATGLSFKF